MHRKAFGKYQRNENIDEIFALSLRRWDTTMTFRVSCYMGIIHVISFYKYFADCRDSIKNVQNRTNASNERKCSRKNDFFLFHCFTNMQADKANMRKWKSIYQNHFTTTLCRCRHANKYWVNWRKLPTLRYYWTLRTINQRNSRTNHFQHSSRHEFKK